MGLYSNGANLSRALSATAERNIRAWIAENEQPYGKLAGVPIPISANEDDPSVATEPERAVEENTEE